MKSINNKKISKDLKTKLRKKSSATKSSNVITGSVSSKKTTKRKSAKTKKKKLKEVLKQDEEADDRTIHTLERLLKLKKNKMSKGFSQDGLDYILNVVDGDMDVSDNELNNAIENSDQEHDDDDDDLDMSCDVEENIEDEVSSCEEESSSDDSTIDETLIVKPKSNSKEKHVRFDLPKISEKYKSVESKKTLENDLRNESKIEDDKNVPESPKVVAKYVPPANRPETDDVEKKLAKIKRQLKGLLNRLSESNMKSICSEIESFYSSNSRARVTHVLSDVVLTQFYTPDPIPEKLVTESAMLIAVLTHNMNTEVIGYFLEPAAKKLHSLLQLPNYGVGKECNNIVQFISSLYQLKIIQKQIVLDMIDVFWESFNERDVELMMSLLKSTGFQLRKDDPISLKSIVEKVTLKSVSMGEQSNRMKFMLDVVTAIKNNNVRKVLDYDFDLIVNRRKKIKALCSKESDPFADVKLLDLVDADKKGRWWIVGSSWGGAPMLRPSKEEDLFESSVSEKVKKAARKLRMNTDVRRRIFYAAMSGDDFVEAFNSVLNLGLKGKQLREVSYVLTKCCQEEKSFNPFYFHLLNKFCHHDRQFVMSLQCAFWDRFKSLPSLSNRNLSNISKLLSSLLISEAIPLSCLKTFDYAEIDKCGVAFLRKVFSNMASDIKSLPDVDKVFVKLNQAKYSSVRNGLRLFINHFMLKDSSFIKENSDIEPALIRMDKQLDSKRQTLTYDTLF